MLSFVPQALTNQSGLKLKAQIPVYVLTVSAGVLSRCCSHVCSPCTPLRCLSSHTSISQETHLTGKQDGTRHSALKRRLGLWLQWFLNPTVVVLKTLHSTRFAVSSHWTMHACVHVTSSELKRLQMTCLALLCRPSQWLSTVVQYVGYSASLKYMLVVLKPGLGGKQLAAMKPDVAAMPEAVPASEMTGVIVAAPATAGAWQHNMFQLLVSQTVSRAWHVHW